MKSDHAEIRYRQKTNWFTNGELEVSLSRRLMVYWCGTLLAIFTVPILARMTISDVPFDALAHKLVSDMWFPMVMSLLTLPIVFWDSIRFSQRFAGPVKRIGNELRRLADGETVSPVRLRGNDFCHDLADDFNHMMQKRSVNGSHEELETSSV